MCTRIGRTTVEGDSIAIDPEKLLLMQNGDTMEFRGPLGYFTLRTPPSSPAYRICTGLRNVDMITGCWGARPDRDGIEAVVARIRARGDKI